MKKSVFASFLGLAGIGAIFSSTKAGVPWYRLGKKVSKSVGNMLWPAYRGTYVRAKHGELKDENGKPRYV